jgi:group I intron endonuclease
MYYTIYQTKNSVNGKVYVGAHKTKDLDDDYIGSGKMLMKAIKKYGLENFEKTILYVFNDQNSMYEMEKNIVNEKFVRREDTYNIKIGGFGGWDHVDNSGRIVTDETKRKMSRSAKIRQTGDTNSFYGKKHKEDSLKLIGEASKKRAKKQYEERMKAENHPNSQSVCPHCGKIGQMRAMKRWHFDNCPKKTFL